jgi:PAB-dependent poly(A)-specific ribonuclease subunit 3
MMNFGQVESAQPLDLTSQLLPGLLNPDDGNAGGGAATAARRRTWATHFMPEHLYEYYAQRSALSTVALPGSHDRVREVPSDYTSVMVLDKAGPDAATPVTGSYGYVSTMYKVISVEDGLTYALRRVDNVRAHPKLLAETTAAWEKVAHPSVIQLRRAFSASGHGPGSIYFAHDYHPGAKNIMEAHTDAKALPERTLWSYVCQLVTGLRAVHEAGLSFRGIDTSHILVTGHNRIRLGGAGVLDVLEADSKRSTAEMQNSDMLGLGHVILQLATRSVMPHRTREAIESSLSFVQANFSFAVSSLVILLLSRPVSIQELCRNLAPQLTAELDSLYDHSDAMDELLAREFENGRLLRILTKLGFVNERPAFDNDSSWSETGDRYSLKLFRDFLFHQVTEEGRPVIDVAHIVDSLNRLDKGTQDKILLSSRDGSSILVASYASLRKAVNTSFEELRQSSHGTEVGPSHVPSAVRRAHRNRAPHQQNFFGLPMNAHSAAMSAAFFGPGDMAQASGFTLPAATLSDAAASMAGAFPDLAQYSTESSGYADPTYSGFAADTAPEFTPSGDYADYGYYEPAPTATYEDAPTYSSSSAGWLNQPPQAPPSAAPVDTADLNAGAPEFKPSYWS